MSDNEEVAAALRIKCPVCRRERGPCYYRPPAGKAWKQEAVVHDARIMLVESLARTVLHVDKSTVRDVE